MSRGYLWIDLQRDVVDEFRVYAREPADLDLQRAVSRDRLVRSWMSVETAEQDERAQLYLRRPREVAWERRHGRAKSDGLCSRSYCTRPRATGTKQCEHHGAIARAADKRARDKRREGRMRERLSETRTGKTLRFEVTSLVGDRLVRTKGYLQTGEYADGRLGEIFVKVGKPGSSSALLDMWAVSTSVALQLGAEVDALFEKFENQRFEPSGSTDVAGIPRCSSLVDLIARWVRTNYGKKS